MMIRKGSRSKILHLFILPELQKQRSDTVWKSEIHLFLFKFLVGCGSSYTSKLNIKNYDFEYIVTHVTARLSFLSSTHYLENKWALFFNENIQ